jgi:hypothetical protein
MIRRGFLQSLLGVLGLSAAKGAAHFGGVATAWPDNAGHEKVLPTARPDDPAGMEFGFANVAAMTRKERFWQERLYWGVEPEVVQEAWFRTQRAYVEELGRVEREEGKLGEDLLYVRVWTVRDNGRVVLRHVLPWNGTGVVLRNPEMGCYGLAVRLSNGAEILVPAEDTVAWK